MKALLKRLWYGCSLIRLPKRLATRWRLARATGPLYLNFAAGPYPRPGWINADITPSAQFYMDALSPLPLADATLDAVFSEHFIEHLEFVDGRRWLKECFRCLKPGGLFRIATPELGRLWRMYDGTAPEVSAEAVVARHFSRFKADIAAAHGADCPHHPCLVFNDKLRLWGHHRFIYDEALLRQVLAETGFVAIEEVAYGESRHDILRGLERHAGDTEWMKSAECLSLEARKPGAETALNP